VTEYSIIHEDAAILAANKLAPLPVQPEKSGDPSLQDVLAAFLGERDGAAPAFFEAVHRIDRRSSGIVLFAKTKKAAGDLSALFRDGLVKKTYWAAIEGEPAAPEGMLEHLLLWEPRRDKARAFPSAGPAPAGCKPASLSYRIAGRSERYILLEVAPVTGRAHQIRAQLAAAGMPIRGDLKYGARRSTRNGLIMLHARAISFEDPSSGETLELSAPPPESEALWAAFGP
jgi:23S rRNA pseudouridine1911/1915/1917 synthase